MRCTISLASRDLIVDTSAVARYLLKDEIPDPVVVGNRQKLMELESDGQDEGWKTRAWRGRGLEVLWCEDLDHAQVFDDKKGREKLVGVVKEYTKMKTSNAWQ